MQTPSVLVSTGKVYMQISLSEKKLITGALVFKNSRYLNFYFLTIVVVGVYKPPVNAAIKPSRMVCEIVTE